MLGWLFFLTLLAALFLLWSREQQAKLQALTLVRRHCQQEDVQLLDDTLMLDSWRLRRLPKLALISADSNRQRPSGWQLMRCYRFEFSSTGDERYSGELVLAGRRLWRLQLQAHRIH